MQSEYKSLLHLKALPHQTKGNSDFSHWAQALVKYPNF